MDNANAKTNEIEKLLSQFKKLNEVTLEKKRLEDTLAQLTFCNNVAALYQNQELFNSKVLMSSMKIVCNSTVNHIQPVQTLVIEIENVSENFIFQSEHWELHLTLNEKLQGTWTFAKALGPGDTDTFCIPLTDDNFEFPLMQVIMHLHFAIDYESKCYSKSFEVMECALDILDCLDPEKYIFDSGALAALKNSSFVNTSGELQSEEENLEFPPLTKFMLKLDPTLMEIFVRDILLCDSLHRGFQDRVDELSTKKEVTVYYLGIRIDVNLSKSDLVVVKSPDPSLLCALKASILRRLMGLEGIVLETLDNNDRERLDSLELKLQSSCFDQRNPNKISADDLMELYLELRDITESVGFGMVHIID